MGEVITDQYNPVRGETFDFSLDLVNAQGNGKALCCCISGTVPLTKLKLILTMKVHNIK